MRRFKGDIVLKRLDKSLWELQGDWQYSNDNVTVIAKSGLTTDGASIPKLVWSIVGSPFSGKYVGSAIIHDALYASERMARKECDELFLEMMRVENVSWLKRYSMYWAVRAGGRFVWKKHTQVTINEGKKYCEVIRKLK